MGNNSCDEFVQYEFSSFEAEKALHSSYIANSVINAFSLCVAIMLNSLTIHAVRKTSSLPKPLKTLLLSLAVSDLGVGLLVQPWYIALLNTQTETLTSSADAALFLVIYLLSYASFLGVLAISVDRFLAIHFHLRYQQLVTHKRVVATVVFIWLSSAVLPVLDFWITSIIYRILLLILGGFCFIFTALIYCRIYLAVRRHTNQIQTLQVLQAAQNGEIAKAARLRKSAVSTFYVYAVLLLCYLPEYCIGFVYEFIYERNTTLEVIELYTWTLWLLNSSLNPVIYCWKMRHIRHAVMEILRNIVH